MNKGINLSVLFMTFIILGFTLLIGVKFYKNLEILPSKEITIQHTGKQETVNVRKVANRSIESEAAKAYKAAKRKALEAANSPKIDADVRIDQQQLYLVIAGGFHDVNKAQNHSLKLRNLGYDAEVVQFKNSRLHVVCAGKFHNPTKAQNTVHSLQQNHQIESYVQVPI